MAPPRNRHSGFSRRIQISLFFGYVIAIAGVIFSLALVMMSHASPGAFSSLRGIAIDAGAPISGIGKTVIGGFQNAEKSIIAYIDAADQNRALRAELEARRRELIEARRLSHENRRLRALLTLREQKTDVVTTARIVGSGFAAPRRFAVISAGTRDGVAPGQPVRTVEGLAGRILETGARASRVLLITDPDSSIPARIARNGVPVLARGRGDGTLVVSALLPGSRPFRRGDLVISSGTGGIYPPDLPVGVIVKADSDAVIAWPLAHPETLDFAMVLRPYVASASMPLEDRESGNRQ